MASEALPRTSRIEFVVWLGVIAALAVALAFSLQHREPASRDDVRARVDAGRSDPARVDRAPQAAQVPPQQATVSPSIDAPASSSATQWDLDFKAARARLDELRWFGEDRAALVEHARSAERQLPMMLGRGSVDAADALLLKADLLEILEPDERRRIDQLTAWWAEHPIARPPNLVKGYRDDQALERERALVLAWQTQPSVDRDVRDLEGQLRQLWTLHR